MMRIWQIAKSKTDEIHFADESSLDAITRQLPDGYYSTFRTYDACTRVLGLSAHLKRLPNVDASLLRRQLFLLLQSYRPDEARVRVMETRSRDIYIAIEPLKPLPREVYENGVRLETTTLRRDSPRIKSTTFIEASDDERRHIAQEGIFEALLVRDGKILEGMTSNFFYILRAERSRWSSSGAYRDPAQSKRAPREALYTAQKDILLGVTRRTVIRVARGRGVDVRYRALGLGQLSYVSEAFITSSSRGIVPVVRIDDVTVGQGKPGKVTKELMRSYEAYVMEKAEKI